MAQCAIGGNCGLKTHSSPERLAGRSARALVTSHRCEGYSFNPGMTQAILKDSVVVRTLLEAEIRVGGQVIRHLPGATEPLGKPLPGWESIAVRLTLYAPGDDECVAGPGHLPAAESP